MTNTDRNVQQVNADAVDAEKEAASQEELTGSVDVILKGVSWTRHDPKTGKTKTHKRNARLTVTEAEWQLLGEGVKPTLVKADEDA